MKKPKRDLEGTILADGVSLGTDMRKTQLNNNVIVFGTPGGGKTEGIVKPNIMQMNSSYVVTDPKGNLLRECGAMLKEAGSDVVCLNFSDPAKSMTYNPFSYVRTEMDLDFLARSIVRAEGRTSADAFWPDSAELLLKALMAYCIEWNEQFRPRCVTTFSDVISVADAYGHEKLGDWDNVSNRLDERMEELFRGSYWRAKGECEPGKRRPRSVARDTWLRFRAVANAPTTVGCIVMELWGRLNRLSGKERERLFSDVDPVDIASLGKRRMALFVVVSDVDRSMDFMVSVFYAQLFKELCRVADRECCDNGNRLRVPVRVILDDFANQNVIDGFDAVIAAVRSRDIWLMPICQATAQLEERYGRAANTIIGCCDAVVYLGVNDMATARELGERADMPVSDIQRMPVGTALVFVRGREGKVAPRFDVQKHPNYRFLAQADPANEYTLCGLPASSPARENA